MGPFLTWFIGKLYGKNAPEFSTEYDDAPDSFAEWLDEVHDFLSTHVPYAVDRPSDEYWEKLYEDGYTPGDAVRHASQMGNL